MCGSNCLSSAVLLKYSAGIAIIFRNVEVKIPPRTTIAIG